MIEEQMNKCLEFALERVSAEEKNTAWFIDFISNISAFRDIWI